MVIQKINTELFSYTQKHIKNTEIMSELELINLVASSERTPQLAEYWTKRYKKFLDERLFVVSDKTKNLLLQKEVVSSPTTPFGHIDLLRFVNKNKGVEEVALQNSIETAVRFLDSCIDTIDFGDDARKIVIEFRKIGLGVIGFEEYLIAKNATSKEDEINYIGNIISGSAYRASEALAEEKGVCGKWNSIKIELRPKSFEFWYDTINGDIKNGLELMEDFDTMNIGESNFEIIPRRNSNILLYPVDSSWQLWSDREDSSIPKFKKETAEIAMISKSEIVELNSDKSYEPSFIEKKVKGLESTKKLSGISSIFNSGKKVVHEWFKEDEEADKIIGINLNKSVGKVVDDKAIENAFFEKPNFSTAIETKNTTEKEISKFAFPKNQKILTAPLTNFTINDIVKVINKKSELFGNIFQINDLEYDDESKNYLATLDSRNGVIVRDSEIEKISVEQLLTDSKVLSEVAVTGIIFSQDGQKVALQKELKLLPQINNCNLIESLDSQLLNNLKKHYNIKPEFADISAVLVKQNKTVVSYILSLASDEISSELDWYGLHEVYDDESRTLVTISVERTKKLQKTIKSKVNELLKDKLDEQIRLLESDYEQKIESEKTNILKSTKIQFESQVKDLKYKLQEKSKELFDSLESIKAEKSKLENEISALESAEKELQIKKTEELKGLEKDFEIEIADLHNQIAASKVKIDSLTSEKEILVDEVKSLNQKIESFQKDFENVGNSHNDVLAQIQMQMDAKHEEYSNNINSLKSEYDQKIIDLNSNYKLSENEHSNKMDAKHEEYSNNINSLKSEYDQKIIDLNSNNLLKEGEYSNNIDSLKSEYESKIDELHSVINSKQGEIKNVAAAKDNELQLALEEQSKVQLDLEQMCLARICQQKESQVQYEKTLSARFENQSQILATKYDADIKKHEEELRDILTKREVEYKTNLNRQKQYYEDLIQKIGFASVDAFNPSPKSKSIKINVEESPETEIETVNHSHDDAFQQSRDNLFKPNLPQDKTIITKIAENDMQLITSSPISKTITSKQDTLNTLLKMKGIVARK